jgi:transcription elongation factor GreA
MSAATVPVGTAFLYPGSWRRTVKEIILTPEGHEKLKEEIEHLSTIKRREVAERIKQAREFGDIAENSEYDDAKNEQAMLEHRIATLEDRLKSSRVVNRKEIPT